MPGCRPRPVPQIPPRAVACNARLRERETPAGRGLGRQNAPAGAPRPFGQRRADPLGAPRPIEDAERASAYTGDCELDRMARVPIPVWRDVAA
jgi:hypothetical protein